MSLTAAISNISRCSVHDGDGIRTVVYFKGCGLRCAWCHNPETLEMHRNIVYTENNCIGCGACIKVCPSHHKAGEQHMVFLRDGCTECGKCADVCPTQALLACGERKTVEEVFAEVAKDRHYNEQSGGGVTLSGGECLLQADFAAALLKKCAEAGIHTAIESAFFVPFEQVNRVLPLVDLVYTDLKIPDSQKHRAYTGQGNELIVENIRRVTELSQRVIVRIPLIPGVNDSISDIRGFAEILNTFGKGLRGVEILKYNSLAASKYEILGMPYHAFEAQKQTAEKIHAFCTNLQAAIKDRCEVFFEE